MIVTSYKLRATSGADYEKLRATSYELRVVRGVREILRFRCAPLRMTEKVRRKTRDINHLYVSFFNSKQVMKKSLFVLGLGMLALASCTNEEVTEVAQNRTIGFNAFVNYTTKADITTADLTTFYAFGDYDNGTSTVFNNTKVTGTSGSTYTPEKVAYWQTGKTYNFGAYSDGGNALTTGVTFDQGTLTISGYSVGANDLIAATNANVSAPAANTDQQVALTFKHLLSKVKFTFTTEAEPAAYKMEVSKLTFEAKKTNAGCTFTNNAIATDWTGDNGTYSITTLGDYAVDGGSASTEEIYVLPQANTTITASFTVTIYDEDTNTQIATKSYSNVSLSTTEWQEGYSYNYTAEINPDDVNDQLKPITFTVTAVDGFTPNSDTDLTL